MCPFFVCFPVDLKVFRWVSFKPTSTTISVASGSINDRSSSHLRPEQVFFFAIGSFGLCCGKFLVAFLPLGITRSLFSSYKISIRTGSSRSVRTLKKIKDIGEHLNFESKAIRTTLSNSPGICCGWPMENQHIKKKSFGKHCESCRMHHTGSTSSSDDPKKTYG